MPVVVILDGRPVTGTGPPERRGVNQVVERRILEQRAQPQQDVLQGLGQVAAIRVADRLKSQLCALGRSRSRRARARRRVR